MRAGRLEYGTVPGVPPGSRDSVGAHLELPLAHLGYSVTHTFLKRVRVEIPLFQSISLIAPSLTSGARWKGGVGAVHCTDRLAATTPGKEVKFHAPSGIPIDRRGA